MPNGSRARVRDAAFGVGVHPRASLPTWTSPPSPSALHNSLTPKDREVVQDWMARRYLQLHEKKPGRRRTDLPIPATVKSASQMERFAKYIRQAASQSKA